MPTTDSYSIPDSPPLEPDTAPKSSTVSGTIRVEHDVSIYDVAYLIQGMMLSAMNKDRDRPKYNDPEWILESLRQELSTHGFNWSVRYLDRCHEVSITDPAQLEDVPLATKGQDRLYDSALVHAGELFWSFVVRHATTAEFRQMSEDTREKYVNGGPLDNSGVTIRRVPERFSPDGEGVRFIPEFPGRPSWLSDETARRCNRLCIDALDEDPFVPDGYASEFTL